MKQVAGALDPLCVLLPLALDPNAHHPKSRADTFSVIRPAPGASLPDPPSLEPRHARARIGELLASPPSVEEISEQTGLDPTEVTRKIWEMRMQPEALPLFYTLCMAAHVGNRALGGFDQPYFTHLSNFAICGYVPVIPSIVAGWVAPLVGLMVRHPGVSRTVPMLALGALNVWAEVVTHTVRAGVFTADVPDLISGFLGLAAYGLVDMLIGRAAKRRLLAEAPHPRSPLCDPIIVCPDDFLNDEAGAYYYTPERFRAAQARAISLYTEALDRPDVDRAVLLLGCPGSGKSTYVRNHGREGTVYYDESQTTTPRDRAALIDEAECRGIPIEAVWIDPPLDVALGRNELRGIDRRIPRKAIERYHEQLHLTPPMESEGFSRVTYLA